MEIYYLYIEIDKTRESKNQVPSSRAFQISISGFRSVRILKYSRYHGKIEISFLDECKDFHICFHNFKTRIHLVLGFE